LPLPAYGFLCLKEIQFVIPTSNPRYCKYYYRPLVSKMISKRVMDE